MMSLSQKTIEWIKEQRQSKSLHSSVEVRLAAILSKVLPDYHAVKELQGLAGGRNDLMLFEYSGKKVLFEIFASKNQVTRDLRILDKTKADVKVAVIIDKEIDPKVFEKFHKENPEDNYPFIFIGELFEKSSIIDATLKLRQIVTGDENVKLQRMIRQKMSFSHFIEICKKDGIDIMSLKDIEARDITFQKVFVTLTLGKLFKLGIQRKKLKELAIWLSDKRLLEYVLTELQLGLNVFLHTDLEGNIGIYNDQELIDWLRIGPELSMPYVLLSMNAVIYEIFDKYYKSPPFNINRQLKITIGRATIYEYNDGRIAHFSVPRKTKAIWIDHPIQLENDDEVQRKSLSNKDILEMISIL